MLLVFLPPLLFAAAFETPAARPARNLWPIARLAIGLVLVTMVTVAAVAQALVPGLGWAAAFALGAIVAPTDAIAATSVFRRLGRSARWSPWSRARRCSTTPRPSSRTGRRWSRSRWARCSWPPRRSATSRSASVGGIAIGLVVGLALSKMVAGSTTRRSRCCVSLLIPFAAYLPAEALHVSGVLAVVTAGLVIGRRLGTILSAEQPPAVADQLEDGRVRAQRARVRADRARAAGRARGAGSGRHAPGELAGLVRARRWRVIATRFAWVFLSSMLPGSPRRRSPNATRRWRGGSRSSSAGRGCVAPCRSPRRSRSRSTSPSGT